MDSATIRMFGRTKAVIGCVHFQPLPGSADYDAAAGMESIFTRAREDALRLQDGGVDALLFTNEADAPYQTRVGPEVVAAMTACIARLRSELAIPFGINMLLDPVAGIAVAHATGARFVRGYFTGGYVGDMGIMDTAGSEAARLRRCLGAREVHLLANVSCAFGVPLAPREMPAIVHGAITHGRVDGVIVSGAAAGMEADVALVSQVVESAAGRVPVLVGTGVTAENVGQMLAVADGVIVASSLKVDGVTLNPVDEARVRAFMSRVNQLR